MATRIFVRTASNVTVPRDFRDGLVLDIFEEPAESTVAGNFQRLVELVGPPSQAAVDFLLFSAAVYVADKKARRRLAADRWTREFDLSMPVSEPDRWTAASPALKSALSFLTGDHWTLNWRRERNRIWRARRTGRGAFDVACLFSGGLDSLVGAIDALEGSDQSRVVLIGHYDSTLTPQVQEKLAARLAEYYGQQRVRLVQILARPAETRSGQAFPLPSARESSTRSRSVVFLGIGLAAASALGPDAQLLIPENGFIALNVPLTNSRLGSCSTRTTHRHFLSQLIGALGQVGISNPVTNPYEFMSKGEMLARCKNQVLLVELAPQTVSCAHPELGRYEQTGFGNCGYCFPCLIRRASMHAVGWDNGGDYKRDICTAADLIAGPSARGRDARAVLASLQPSGPGGTTGRLVPLLAGPVSDRPSLDALARVYQQGRQELTDLFRANATPAVRQWAGL